MKTLYLVRHAKSSWDDISIQDYERPLLNKGINRTLRVARFLISKKIIPDLIVSSHAVRAFETASLLAEKLGYPKHEILIDDQLYFSGPEAIHSVVFGLPDDKKDVMLVGHNPDMTKLANEFLHDKIDYLPTTGVVSVSFETEKWEEVLLVSRVINFVISPKSVKE
jgi:phosphohistidine phosphatase